MTSAAASAVGEATGASAIGRSHLARGKPNQDHVGWRRTGVWTSIAVADGHGSAPHYRSDRGSRFAVEALLALFEQVTRGGLLREPDALTREIPALPGRLVSLWRAAVEADVASDPIPERPGAARHAVYGSTCLGASVGPGATLLVQIGDGNLFVGPPAVDVARPFEEDDLEGEQTYSLCLPDAEHHVKVALFVAPSPYCAPDFILAATDGFEKSFTGPEGALDIVRHYRRAVAERGLDAVAAELGPWLANCSAMGSGDDTTVAILAAEHGARDRAPPAATPLRAAAGEETATPPPIPARRTGAARGSRAAALAAAALAALAGGMAVERWRRPLVGWLAPPQAPGRSSPAPVPPPGPEPPAHPAPVPPAPPNADPPRVP